MTGYIPFPEWITPEISPWLPIRWYAVMYIVAFLITFILFRLEARRSRLSTSTDEIAVFFTWIVGGALVGARIGHVLLDSDIMQFLRQPWLLVWPFREGRYVGIQGMSYPGALVGVAAGAALFSLTRRKPLLPWIDVLAISAPLGYAVGRLGNFINEEMLGTVSAAPWAVLFPHARRVPVSEPWALDIALQTGIEPMPYQELINLPRHPAQLYLALLAGVVLWVILWVGFRKSNMFDGALASLYLAGYGLASFVAGYFRAPEETTYVMERSDRSAPAILDSLLVLADHQVVAASVLLLGVGLLVWFRVRHQPEATIKTYTE